MAVHETVALKVVSRERERLCPDRSQRVPQARVARTGYRLCFTGVLCTEVYGSVCKKTKV